MGHWRPVLTEWKIRHGFHFTYTITKKVSGSPRSLNGYPVGLLSDCLTTPFLVFRSLVESNLEIRSLLRSCVLRLFILNRSAPVLRFRKTSLSPYTSLSNPPVLSLEMYTKVNTLVPWVMFQGCLSWVRRDKRVWGSLGIRFSGSREGT